jgi:hypothetical protein
MSRARSPEGAVLVAVVSRSMVFSLSTPMDLGAGRATLRRTGGKTKDLDTDEEFEGRTVVGWWRPHGDDQAQGSDDPSGVNSAPLDR